MTILVTGATGFVGGALVHQLLRQPMPLRVLARTPAKARDLQALGIEVVQGDVRDAFSVQKAMEGVHTLYHVAAVYDMWLPDREDIVRIAVEGTRTVLQAALDAGVQKVVYTSSCNTIGERQGTIGNEETVHRGYHLAVYERAKHLAEQVALSFVEKGLPVVIVNPGCVYGPGDFKPTGRVLLQSIQGKLPAVPPTMYPYVYVEDVARGHILAAEKGQIGQRYLLADRPIRMLDFVNEARALLGLKATGPFPHQLGLVLGHVSEAISALTRTPPLVALDGIRVGMHGIQVDGSKATRELGLEYTPRAQALPVTLDWYLREGHIRGRLRHPSP